MTLTYPCMYILYSYLASQFGECGRTMTLSHYVILMKIRSSVVEMSKLLHLPLQWMHRSHLAIDMSRIGNGLIQMATYLEGRVWL